MKCINKSNRDMSKLDPFVRDFLPYAQKYMKFDKLPTIMYYSDQDNAAKTLGRTAYYDPSAYQVVLYVDDRHPKDIMRSLSHELVHHKQNCGGQFKGGMAGEEGYAQNDPHLREMEREAYELGNMCFRDWEDTRRDYLQENKYYKGESKMSLKEWKNKELNRLLSQKWGYTLNEGGKDYTEKDVEDAADATSPEVSVEPGPDDSADDDDGEMMQELAASSGRAGEKDRKGDDERKLEEEEEGVFAPNHYCVHHGGVNYNGKVQMAEAVSHNYNFKLNRVTHYDMKLANGTILENVAVEDIQVTNASLAEGHGGHMSRQDREDDEERKLEEEEEKSAEDLENDAVDANQPDSKGLGGKLKSILNLEERIHKAIKEAVMEIKS